MRFRLLCVASGALSLAACSGRCGASPGDVSASAPPAFASGPAVPLSAPLQSPGPSGPELTLRAFIDGLKAGARALRPEWYSVSARAKALGAGVEAPFKWVRDNVRYDAYPGVLRGAEGTLAAGAGNAFDRSLLLARLLRVQGIQTRFAVGQLTRQQAELLFQHMFDGRQIEAPADGRASTSDFLARVTLRARRDQAVIREALGPGYVPVAATAREEAIADIQHHAWIQANVDGRWLDLDTSFGDAEPSRTYGPAEQTFDEIQPAWHQTVTIRVTSERVEDGTLSTSIALEMTLPAVDLIDRRVFLVHVPAASSGGLGLGAGQAHGDRWAPVLLLNEQPHAGEPIDFADADTGSGFDALGGGGTSGFVSEWLELEVVRPDGRRDTSRRALVDRAGAAWRASPDHPLDGLRPLPRDDKELFDPRSAHQVMFSAGPHDLRRYGRGMASMTLERIKHSDGPPRVMTALRQLALRNEAAVIWTDDVIAPGLDQDPQVRVYCDSPRIAIVSLVPQENGGFMQAYDLRRDTIRSIARSADGDAAAADRKVWFAAFEGALEHESSARDAVSAGIDPAGVRSTSALLTPEGVLVLKPTDIGRLPEVTKDPETRARLDASLRAGSTALIPRSALAMNARGWWEISSDGDIRAILGDLNAGMWNSGLGAKPLPGQPTTWNVGEMGTEASRAADIEKAMAEGAAEGSEGAEAIEAAEAAAAAPTGGNEYQVTLIKVANVAIAVGIVAGMIWHHQYMKASQAEYDAWSAAEDAKQQRALRAAGAAIR